MVFQRPGLLIGRPGFLRYKTCVMKALFNVYFNTQHQMIDRQTLKALNEQPLLIEVYKIEVWFSVIHCTCHFWF